MKMLAALGSCLILIKGALAAPKPLSQPAFDIAPDADGHAYRAELSHLATALDASTSPQDIANYLREAGTRNLEWLDHLNATRPTGKKLRLTDRSTRPSYPITSPKVYSPETLERDFTALRPEIPAQIWAVVFEASQPTSSPLQIDEATFLRIARQIDRLYQTAARWILTEPNRLWYIAARKGDVRGYVFLGQEPDLATKLANFAKLDPSERERLGGLLLGLCNNDATMNESACRLSLNSLNSGADAGAFYNRYRPAGQRAYERLLRIQNPRREMVWAKNANGLDTATLAFRDPRNDAIRDFLQVNIQDEWKWTGWQLLLNFTNNASVHMEFEAGVVPHVNGLGGNTITMDGNAPIEEYEVQWTIRHEFGHVLGFPDCYVEFYDDSRQAMTNYQTDTTDLMCSRAGNLLERHVSEMRRAYGPHLDD